MQGLTTLDFQILHTIQRIFFLFRFRFSHAEDYCSRKWWNSLDFACNSPANSSENSKKRDTTGGRLHWLWTNWKFVSEKCDSKESPLLDRRPYHVDCNAN